VSAGYEVEEDDNAEDSNASSSSSASDESYLEAQRDEDVFDPEEDIDEFAEMFVDMFCGDDHSEAYEALRKKEALAFLQDADDDVMNAIIGKIHGAKRGSSEEERRELLSSWVRCTPSERVVEFITLSEMKEFYQSRGDLPRIALTGKVESVRVRLAGALHQAEYEDGTGMHYDEDDDAIYSGDNASIV
jgi:hypothetical protein